jgi:hypothetical protein
MKEEKFTLNPHEQFNVGDWTEEVSTNGNSYPWT